MRIQHRIGVGRTGGADGGTRTRTPKRTTDFKSVASTIPPHPHAIVEDSIIALWSSRFGEARYLFNCSRTSLPGLK